MNTVRNTIFYISTLLIFMVLMWVALERGKMLESGHSGLSHPQTSVESTVTSAPVKGVWEDFRISMAQNLHHSFSILLLQIIIIILISRLFGYFFQKFGQPMVIGEVLAGIILGPSFLGLFFPGIFSFVFPAESLGNLQFLSQIGLILFMFIIGMELDLKLLKNTAGTAILVSHASIIFPYLLGVVLSLYLFVDYAPASIGFLPFALFMGISMSITAFPVLARILQERGLTRTPLGTMSLTCGAIDDVTAWGILAAVIAIVKSGTLSGAVYTIGLTIVYLVIMLLLVQPFLLRVEGRSACKIARE